MRVPARGSTLGAPVDACTVVSRNYLAQARVVAHSFLDHHPGSRFVVLVLDGVAPGTTRPDDRFEIVTPDEVLDRAEYARLAAIYGPLELSCALKPTILAHLLDTGSSAACYLDGDVAVYADLLEVAALAEGHGVVLTPHVLTPPPLDGLLIPENEYLVSGTFNAGFVAVGASGRAFVDWWASRLARGCIFAEGRGYYVDQHWLDLVPSYFSHHVLRDPGCNVAYWNLHERPLSGEPGRFRIANGPLRFVHFSGFDPHRPERISKQHLERLRFRVEPGSALAALLAGYARDLLAAGLEDCSRHGYAAARTARGLALTPPVRRLLRHALLAAEAGAGPPPPNVFDGDGGAALAHWLRQPPPGGDSGLSRILAHVREERPDLRAAFPDVPGADQDAYVRWAAAEGRRHLDLPPEVLAVEAPPAELAGAGPVALAWADELLGDPALLDEVAAPASPTIAILVAEEGAEATLARLEAALAAGAPAGAGSVEAIALIAPVDEPALAAALAGVLTRRPVPPPFGHLPRLVPAWPCSDLPHAA